MLDSLQTSLKNHPEYLRGFLWALLPGIAFGFALYFQSLDNPVYGVFIVLPMLMMAGASVIPGFRKGFSVPWNGLALIIAIYAGFLAISTLWSVSPFESVLFLNIFLILPFMFFAVSSSQYPRALAYGCLAVFGIGFACLTLWVFFQFFFLYDTYGPRIHNPFLNPNDLGALLAVGVLIATSLFLQSSNKIIVYVALVLAIMLLAGVFMAQGRAILLAMLISFATLTFMLRKSTDVLKFRAPIFFLLAFILFVLIDSRAGQRISVSLSQIIGQGIVNASVDSRVLLWQSTLKMALDHFWGGIGLGNFHYYYPQYRSPQDSSDGYFTHMDPLQFWAECGILLPVLFYGIMFFVLLRTIKVMKHAPDHSLTRAIVGGTFCGMLALVLHTHLSFDMYQPSIVLAMSAAFALWYVEGESVLPRERREWRVSKNPISLLCAALLVVAISWPVVWSVRTSIALWYFKHVSFAPDQIDHTEETLDKAVFWSPDSYSVAYEYPGRMHIHGLESLPHDAPLEEKEKIYNEGRKLFEAALKRSPLDSYARFYQAILFERGFEAGVDVDGRSKAITASRELLQDDALMMQARMGLATMYESDNQPQLAFNALYEGMRWPKLMQPISVEYFMRLAGYYQRANNKQGYDFMFNEAQNWNARIEGLKGKK